MKKFLILVSLFGTACGSKHTASQLNDSSSASSNREAYALEGRIKSVEPLSRFGSPSDAALPSFTKVTIAYDVRCSEKFEKFSKFLRYEDLKVEIFASAIASSEPPVQGTIGCQSIGEQLETVIIRGAFSVNDVTLVNLKGEKATAPSETFKYSSDVRLEMLSAQSLCIPDAPCFTRGTAVVVRAHLSGCFDELGPVTFATSRDATSNRLRLAVSAINLENSRSRVALCPERLVEAEIPLLNLSVDQSSIDFIVVK